MTRCQWAKVRDYTPAPVAPVEPQTVRLRTVLSERDGTKLVRPIANVSVEAGASSNLLAVKIREYFRGN